MDLLFYESSACTFAELVARHGSCTACETVPLSSAFFSPRHRVGTAAGIPEQVFDQTLPVRLRAATLTASLAAASQCATVEAFERLGVCGSEGHCDFVTFTVLEYGLEVFVPLLQVTAATGSGRLGVLARQMIVSVVAFEGSDAERWSPSARWLTGLLTGFLPDAVVREGLPVAALAAPRLPGFSPCLVPFVVRSWSGLGEGGREVFSRLFPEWSGSLSGLTTASALLAGDRA